MKQNLLISDELSICHGKTCVHTKGDSAKALTFVLAVILIMITIAQLTK